MPAATSEADIVFNRANVALAKSQRLIASWLPPKTADETANAKTEEDLDREEQEIFTPVPDQLGLGAPLPKDVPDGTVKRRDLSSNEALRKRLLGKNANKIQSKSLPTLHGASKPLPGNIAPAGNRNSSRSEARHSRHGNIASDDDEDEGGRSSLGKSKKRAASIQEEPAASEESKGKAKADEESDDDIAAASKTRPAPVSQSAERSLKRARAANFLDEILAEKAQRKKKKKNKNKNKQNEAGEGNE